MKIEMHTHTCEVSPCAAVPARRLVEAYAEAGYKGIVITDHFNDYVLGSFSGTKKEKVDHFLSGYYQALEAGQEYGVKIFFGLEATLLPHGYNDFLIYGATPDFLYEYPELYKMSQKEVYKICCRHELLMYQAHPFRSYCRPQNPNYLHGAEIYNGNPYQKGTENYPAEKWAKKHGLLTCSGSDFHHMFGIARGGIITSEHVNSEKELIEHLKRGVTLIKSI